MLTVRKPFLSSVLAAVVLLSSACGTQTASPAAGAGNGSKAGGEEKVLRVGTSGRSVPHSYKNEKQELDGFDVEAIKAIADKMGYKVDWVTADFSGLFGMLDANKIDTIANQVEISDQRKEKYLFSIPYVYSGGQLVVKKGNDSIKSLQDLKGKKIAVGLGTNKEKFLREFDNEKGVKMNIVTYEDPSGIVYDVANGRADAYIVDKASGLVKIEKSGLPLQFAGEPFEDYIIAYPFVKNAKNNELKDKFDKALEELQKDGTMSKLSMKFYKQDISKK
ncbi:amino acid ABC transporter substrate-binding protein [Paenibacillus rigui]|uniref:Amino acid ABC transporter substrate-binding protein n=1 Tax=Paenibacillus rigui TaxID=554312 RepID=A0A229UQ75_9BACL|nr:amino acid ABC transporter substrate-binding protein [Paenibacillus rigui]OXM85520.1 amino acid ABC transporter substrate-binding protein [Paenibacillus rigui]